jgi:ABC-type amino acid transport substrate-binding protein
MLQRLLPLLCLALAALPARADWDQIAARGTLRVLAVPVPGETEFFDLRPGQPPGFEHELLLAFARQSRLRLEVVPAEGWDRLVPELLAGRGDLIAGRFTDTPARRAAIAFGVPVFPTRAVVVTRKPTPLMTSVEGLRRLKVGLVGGTNLAELVAAAGVPAAQVDATIPSGGAFAALKAGRIQATVEEVSGAILASKADPALQLGLFLGPPGAYAWGLRKEDAELRRRLNDYADAVRRTPTWSRLVVQYFGESALEVLKKARGE